MFILLNLCWQVDGPEVKMDMRFCYKQPVNFTFGLSDHLYVQFKTDKDFRQGYMYIKEIARQINKLDLWNTISNTLFCTAQDTPYFLIGQGKG